MAAVLTAAIACSLPLEAYASGWVAQDGGWRYITDDSNAPWLTNGWYWLDGNQDGVSECYYFNEYGWMMFDATTPDQYTVNADGAWVVDGKVQTRVTGGPGAPAAGANGTVSPAPPDAAAGPAPPDAAVAGAAVSRVIDPTKPMVALTFDDGPQTTAGNRILDTLSLYGAKATFFVVGERCASRAAEMQRMVLEGHEVGNHTYEHKYLQKLSAEQIQYQINRGIVAIAESCGVWPMLVRLPGGNKNSTVLANVNYPMIQWSIDTRDWDHKNAQRTINEVLTKVQDGDIILMHELYDATATAVEVLVPELIARGYQLVTVSEMAQAKGVQLLPGQLYYSFH